MRRAVVLAAALGIFAASPAAHADGKSRATALALSGVGTAVSSGLILASVLFAPDDSHYVINQPLFISGVASSVFTPSLGQYYAGEYITVGMGIRAASGALAAIGAYGFTETHRCNLTDECTELTQQGVVILGLAAIAYIGGVAYDVLDTTDSVDRYNRKHGVYMGVSMSVARASDDSLVPLIGIHGRL